MMRKNRKINFRDLVNENKKLLMSDEKFMEEIERKLDEKHMKNL
ncbi:FbpB family small basic protein [Fictibacillus aquaticus]